MATITQPLLQELQVELSKIYEQAYDDGPEHASRLATMVSSSTLTTTYGWMKRILQAREWLGPREIQNLDTIATQLTNRDFELTVGADRNEIEDDMLGLFTNVVAQMGRQMRYVPTTLVLELMVQGHVAGNLGFDGQIFFSAAHDLDPAGNQSNVGSTAFSAAAWEDTRATMRQYTATDGRPLNSNPNLVVGPPQLEGEFKRVFTAERNANGATNVNREEAQYLIIPELEDSNDWYVLDTSKGIMPFLYQNRKSPEFVSKTALTDDNVFNLRRFVWGADMRGVAGYGPWWLAFKHVVA